MIGILAADAPVTPAVITATATLLGVVIGGALTGVVQELRERRKDRRLAAAGARLLQDDLEHAGLRVQRVLDRRTVIVEDVPDVPPAWTGYREVLAEGMSDQAWDAVRRAVAAVAMAAAELTPYTSSHVDHLPEALLGRLGRVPPLISAAAAKLESYRRTG